MVTTAEMEAIQVQVTAAVEAREVGVVQDAVVEAAVVVKAVEAEGQVVAGEMGMAVAMTKDRLAAEVEEVVVQPELEGHHGRLLHLLLVVGQVLVEPHEKPQVLPLLISTMKVRRHLVRILHHVFIVFL